MYVLHVCAEGIIAETQLSPKEAWPVSRTDASAEGGPATLPRSERGSIPRDFRLP